MPGGLGLFIVRTIARDLAYAREGALNRLTMRLAR
jgi:anti-sigma regulatory factor (Ser/Thr protein kinase)